MWSEVEYKQAFMTAAWLLISSSMQDDSMQLVKYIFILHIVHYMLNITYVWIPGEHPPMPATAAW